MKTYLVFAVLTVASLANAQTPPILPQTPDIVIPPAIKLPSEVESGRAPLSVEEAVAIAVKNQPLIAIARGNVTAAQARVQQSGSALQPQFGATGSFSDSRTLRGGSGTGSGGSSPNRFSTGVSVDQLLFDFGRTRDLVRQQSALERAQQQAFIRTSQTVVLNVKQAFYNLQQNLVLLGVSEANVASRQRQLDQSQARLDTGLGAPGDVVRAKTNLADAVLSLENARNAVSNARVTLAEQMGIDPLTPITPTPSSEAVVDGESELQSLVTQALTNRPDIREAQERVSAARFAVSAANKGNLPRVSATAGLGGRGANEPFSTQTATFGINVTWDFGDGGLTAGRVREARASEDIARQQLLQTTQGVVSDVSQAWVDLATATQRVATAEAQVANATELVRIAEGRYSGGIGIFLDVVDAQNSLVSAQRNLAQAQLDVQRNRARLRAAIGQS